ncbi:Type IV secretion system protein virB1 [Pseudomonas syringae pv. actinidiae]|nr:Type IV secretion system protein virB1 [Pseudomonas syringae pv. actinidiae]
MLTTSAFLALAMQCAPSIHPATLTPIVKTESSFNPYAIGPRCQDSCRLSGFS